jgi:hypothetical protein
MNPLKIILIIKIIFTDFFWSLPLLFFPRYAARILGIRLAQPIFLHLLGGAFFALLSGYILGLRDLHYGKDAHNTVWVGIISNGVAFIILLVFRAEWCGWGSGAMVYMGGSAIMTLLITLGLIARIYFW